MQTGKKLITFRQVLDLFGCGFMAWSFAALVWFAQIGNWAYFDSNQLTLVNGWWWQLNARVAFAWLYWFGGAAYILTLGILVYCLPRVLRFNWRFCADRAVALIFLVLSTAILCQMFEVGSHGTLPGGGAFGVWLLKRWALPKMVWLVVAKFLLWAGLILYTRLILVVPARYLVAGMAWLSQPLQAWFTAWWARVWHKQQPTSLNENLHQTLLEHEYAEVLAELDAQIHQDQFWQNYATPKTNEAVNNDEPLNMTLFGGATNLSMDADTTTINMQPTELPELKLHLAANHASKRDEHDQQMQRQATVLVNKLSRFGILGTVTAIKPGPVITLFEFTPAEDAKISKIVALESDLALALQTASLRIIAPVPGKAVVGFEVANHVREPVMLSDVLQDRRYVDFVQKVKQKIVVGLPFQIPIALGKDTIGGNVIIDLVKAPHLLVAGSTGSGKSVALNSILVSMLCANPPERLRLILIDPKRLEFARYADLGHLLFPTVVDPKRTLLVLRWVVREMELRYEKMAAAGVRSLVDYNARMAQVDPVSVLPYLVIVIDELADLMMTTSRDVEDLIIRIAQMARAAGIHMIVATQRPSVDVVTGLIKVNFPSRISFRVASKADSRTILDCNGADALLGAGDMLMLDSQSAILQRAHGAYVTDAEISEVVNFILDHYQTNYLNFDQLEFTPVVENGLVEDELFEDVLSFLRECDEVSISLLQRRFRIGYNRSARIMDRLESSGYVLTLDSGKLRKVVKDRLE